MATNEHAPLAPEFVIILQENAAETLNAWLVEHGAPDCIRDLAGWVSALGHYWDLFDIPTMTEAQRLEQIERVGIDELVRDTVNTIVESGGIFRGPCSTSVPRPAPGWQMKGGE